VSSSQDFGVEQMNFEQMNFEQMNFEQMTLLRKCYLSGVIFLSMLQKKVPDPRI
jgi:hypothetical protein